MAARAMWKGVIRFGDVNVPVKMFSAIEDRNVHFRLLHRKDKLPVKQAMVNPETGSIVPYAETKRAFVTDEGDLVMLDREELDALEPEKSRDIDILHFLPQHEIDHRWYDRPYYLGPDGASEEYFALAAGLESAQMEGLAHWVMRNKEYIGALRVHDGYPMLMSLRHAEEVIPVESLEAPSGKPLDEKELSMARQLIAMLEAKFEPEEYRDEYRERVLKMLEAKKAGRTVKVLPFRKRAPSEDLTAALEASLRSA
ncbi:MAG TPA: Ku protein [Gammaproteobacteria bacterium]